MKRMNWTNWISKVINKSTTPKTSNTWPTRARVSFRVAKLGRLWLYPTRENESEQKDESSLNMLSLRNSQMVMPIGSMVLKLRRSYAPIDGHWIYWRKEYTGRVCTRRMGESQKTNLGSYKLILKNMRQWRRLRRSSQKRVKSQKIGGGCFCKGSGRIHHY